METAMLKIAICDDEQVALTIISSALKREFENKKIQCEFDLFNNSSALIEKINTGKKYDALFADISMPGMNGIELGVAFRNQLSDTILIFISTREDLVFETFRAQPFRFIRKKTFQEELPSLVFDLCKELIRRQETKIPVHCGSTTVLLSPEKIIYVESLRKKQIIHSEQRILETQSSFQKIMEQLQAYPFVQSHKSFFVNCRYIHAINRTSLELEDQTILPIGRSRLADVKNAFNRYLMEKTF